MKIELWDILDGSDDKTHIDVQPVDFFKNLKNDFMGFSEWSSPLSLTIGGKRRGDNFDVEIGADIEAVFNCSRCGCDFKFAIHHEETIPFILKDDGFYLTGIGSPSAEGIVVEDNHILCADELLRQSLELKFPEYPLCSKECKGICANCGANLNNEGCKCE